MTYGARIISVGCNRHLNEGRSLLLKEKVSKGSLQTNNGGEAIAEKGETPGRTHLKVRDV